MQRLFLLALLFLFVLLPDTVSAQLVTCSGVDIPGSGEVPCGTCEFVSTLKNAFQLLITLISIAATITLVYVGLRLVTSGGDVAAKTAAKTALINICLGLLFVIASFAIIDAIMKALVSDASLLNWDRVECIYAVIPESRIAPLGGQGLVGNADLPPVSGVDLCNDEYLSTHFPGEERIAQCVLQGESTCGAHFYSTTDFSYDMNGQRVPFSVSPWQINLSVHEIRAGDNCSSGPIDCKSAYSGVDFGSRLQNWDIYNQCVDAFRDPACSGSVARRIRDTSRGWRHWSAYSRNGCG